MKRGDAIAKSEVEALAVRLTNEAEGAGYHLNPDRDFTLGLVEGLLTNARRYGYQVCPCRLATGNKEKDLDIICPCDYRDADLVDWGACYCALYVGDAVLVGTKKVGPVPERRPPAAERVGNGAARGVVPAGKSLPLPSGLVVALPVWRCRVCGYLCAREAPPGVCPICKAKAERFERFL